MLSSSRGQTLPTTKAPITFKILHFGGNFVSDLAHQTGGSKIRIILHKRYKKFKNKSKFLNKVTILDDWSFLMTQNKFKNTAGSFFIL